MTDHDAFVYGIL